MLRRYLTLGITTTVIALTSCIPIGASVQLQTRSQMVEISPGIWVYEDDPQEVFFVNGYYWRRSGANWHRSSDHDRGYHAVEARIVPSQIVVIPNGQYRRYHRVASDRHEKKGERKESRHQTTTRGDHR